MTTDNIFIWLMFAALIFSTITYDRVQVHEQQTAKIHTMMLGILETHTHRLTKWGPPRKGITP